MIEVASLKEEATFFLEGIRDTDEANQAYWEQRQISYQSCVFIRFIHMHHAPISNRLYRIEVLSVIQF